MRRFILVFGVALFLSFVGCNGGMQSLYSDDEMSKVYEDKEELLDEGDTISINKDETIIDDLEYTRFLEIEGVQTIWNCDVREGVEVKLEYELDVKNGWAKIIFVDSNGKITKIAETNGITKDSKKGDSLLKLTKGKNRIRVVGKDRAKLELEANIEAGVWSDGSI